MEVTQESIVFRNQTFKLVERTVCEEGKVLCENHQVWDRREESFAVIVAITQERKIILLEEPKYGVIKRILNLPAGAVDPGEHPKKAAERELLEETGYTCQEIIPSRSGIIDFANKIAGGEHYLFTGFDAFQVKDPEEFRKPVLLDLSEAKSLIAGNHPHLKIETAMSLACMSITLMRMGLLQ